MVSLNNVVSTMVSDPSGPGTCLIVDAVVGHVRARSTRGAEAGA